MLSLFHKLKSSSSSTFQRKLLEQYFLSFSNIYKHQELNLIYSQKFHTMEESFDEKCIFCRIVKERSSEFFYEDDDFVAFKDIRPATSHHYLIIPKGHVKNPATLTSSDIDLVKRLLSIGEEVLRTQNANLDDARYGYHWPPFNSVQHLHMHAISPASEMNFISRMIFRPNSYWFITVPSLIERLEKGK